MEASEYKGKFYGKNKLWKFDNVEMPPRKPNSADGPQTVTAANDNEPTF